MYGHDDIKIIYGDALASHSDIDNDNFSILIANPPYSVKGFLETLSEDDRAKFTLSTKVKEISSNGNIETFFVERAKQLLKAKGIAVIILPSSILSNVNIYESCREIILKYFYIVAIAQFGSDTFGKTNTNTVTLFLRRRDSNPPAADHYQNRVDAWFNADDTKNFIFDDSEIINKYCEICKIDVQEYKDWLHGEKVPSAAIFERYIEKFKKSSEYKQIVEKKLNKQYSKEMKEVELATYLNNKIKSIEKEKLYYFMLASDSPTQTIIMESPKKEIKNFLGYEWIDKNEYVGISYLGDAKNINEINTPLFNPKNFDDDEKINTLIRKNFNGDDFDITESLRAFVAIHRLVDLIDFENVDFNKKIRLQRKNSAMIFNSEYQLVTFGDYIESAGGTTFKKIYQGNHNDKDIPFYKVSDMNTVGNEKFMNKSNNYVSEEILKNEIKARIFEKGTIIFPKVGQAIHTNKKRILSRRAAVDNNIMAIRSKNDLLTTEYLYVFLKFCVNLSYIANDANPPSINTTNFNNSPLILPPLEIQKQIVSEFDDIDATINEQDEIISQCYKNVNDKFVEMFDRKNFDTIRLEEIVDTLGGLWSGKNPPFKTAKIIRNTNFTMQGELNLKDVAVIKVEESKLESRKLRYGDIILEKSGGSENQAVGRVVLFNLNEERYSFSNFTARLRIINDEIKPIYLHAFLNEVYRKGKTFDWQHGMSGLKNLDMKKYLQIEVPLPPLELQEQFTTFVNENDIKKADAFSQKQSLLEERNRLINKYFFSIS